MRKLRRKGKPDARRNGSFTRNFFGLAVVGLVLALFFLQAGKFLVVEDSFTHAEVALMLSGKPTGRALGVRDLYREGKVDRLWVILEPPAYGPIYQALLEINLVQSGDSQWSERILAASQVPQKKITLFPGVHSTLEEAKMIRDHLAQEKSPSRLVLVTGKTHTRRARFIFRSILKNQQIEVLVYPTPYDSFEPVRWWSRPKDALRVFDEYAKLLVNSVELVWSIYGR